MPDGWNEEKRRLLMQYKDQTILQLQAIQEEDPERFLESVEACGQLIVSIDRLNQEQQVPDIEAEKLELKEMIHEILVIREHISQAASVLSKKLEQGVITEKRTAQLNKVYGDEQYSVPSVFYDKRK